jgi:hypothetical protein
LIFCAHDAARRSTRGRQLHILRASTESEVDAAFVSLVKMQTGVLVIGTTASADTNFPEPDSPAMATVSPADRGPRTLSDAPNQTPS